MCAYNERKCAPCNLFDCCWAEADSRKPVPPREAKDGPLRIISPRCRVRRRRK